MSKISYRNWQAFMFLMTFTVFFISFFLQYRFQLEPCPLCLMQRLCAGLFAVSCLLAVRLNTMRGRRNVLYVQIVWATLGVFFAIRQLWLQALPPSEVATCLPALEIMIEYFPWPVILKTLLWGSTSCSEVTWQWWGISIAGWSLLYFSVIFCLCVALLWRLALVAKKNTESCL